MKLSTYRISLDIHKIASQAIIKVKKGDSGRKICVSLTETGKPYIITEDCTAVFRCKKPDGTVLYNSCKIKNNIISCLITSQAVSAVGEVECEVTLYGSDKLQITSPNFVMLVVDALYSDDEIESTNEFTALTEAIAMVDGLVSDIEQKLESGEFKGEKGDRGDQGLPGKDGKDGVGRATSGGGEIFNDYANNQANNKFSTVRGKNNVCNAQNAVVGGANNYVSSNNSFTHGESLTNTHINNTTVFGRHNAENPNSVFEVGFGQNKDNRYNAFEVVRTKAANNDNPMDAEFKATVYQRGKTCFLATEAFVNHLVGDVESTLDAIIAIQKSLIGGNA